MTRRFAWKNEFFMIFPLTRTERIAKNKIHARKERLSPEEQWNRLKKHEIGRYTRIFFHFYWKFKIILNNIKLISMYSNWKNLFLNFLIHEYN